MKLDVILTCYQRLRVTSGPEDPRPSVPRPLVPTFFGTHVLRWAFLLEGRANEQQKYQVDMNPFLWLL